jgi:hypothetical protein
MKVKKSDRGPEDVTLAGLLVMALFSMIIGVLLGVLLV